MHWLAEAHLLSPLPVLDPSISVASFLSIAQKSHSPRQRQAPDSASPWRARPAGGRRPARCSLGSATPSGGCEVPPGCRGRNMWISFITVRFYGGTAGVAHTGLVRPSIRRWTCSYFDEIVGPAYRGGLAGVASLPAFEWRRWRSRGGQWSPDVGEGVGCRERGMV
jgi:hypothetical protein